MEYLKTYRSPIGMLTLSSDGEHLTGLWIEGQKYFGRTLGKEICEKELPLFDRTAEWLDRYFSGKRPAADLPLAPKGTDFQKEVWEILRTIPYGETTTYSRIAEKIAEKRGIPSMSAQAVGGAVGHNPISILIPCHRVIGSDGSLTGYAAGIRRKKALLQLEKEQTPDD